jgi:Flp pilus assembly protein TadD
LTNAWIAFGQGQLPLALERFGRIIAKDPKKYGYLRFIRASAFANSQKYDSAASELSSLLTQLRGDDDKTLGSVYQSKELLEFAFGLLQEQMRRTAAAKDAYGRAIAENAAFAAAHAALGRLAIAARDSGTALVEFGLAVETEPNDVEMRIGYGQALMLAQRPKDAAVQFQKAVELEPYYAEPVFLLATALEGAGDAAGAKQRFGKFLELATRSDPHRAEAERKK